MKTTTICIPTEIRDKIKEFGNKGETYGDVLKRMITTVEEVQLEKYLLDTTNCVPIEEALQRAKKKWQK